MTTGNGQKSQAAPCEHEWFYLRTVSRIDYRHVPDSMKDIVNSIVSSDYDVLECKHCGERIDRPALGYLLHIGAQS
jgi:hypothetical protein